MDRVGCFFDLTPMRQLPAVFLCFLACAPGDMRTKCFMSGLLVSGCARVTDQLYSKKNFNSQSFVADMSECKRQNPSSPRFEATSRIVKIKRRILTMQWCATALRERLHCTTRNEVSLRFGRDFPAPQEHPCHQNTARSLPQPRVRGAMRSALVHK
jgi:hypothetical protein